MANIKLEMNTNTLVFKSQKLDRWCNKSLWEKLHCPLYVQFLYAFLKYLSLKLVEKYCWQPECLEVCPKKTEEPVMMVENKHTGWEGQVAMVPEHHPLIWLNWLLERLTASVSCDPPQNSGGSWEDGLSTFDRSLTTTARKEAEDVRQAGLVRILGVRNPLPPHPSSIIPQGETSISWFLMDTGRSSILGTTG